jgi:hypothetical protein
MKGQKKGKHFADVREVKKKTLEVLNSISNEKISRNVFSSGKKKHRLYKCIELKGEYFEGD